MRSAIAGRGERHLLLPATGSSRCAGCAGIDHGLQQADLPIGGGVDLLRLRRGYGWIITEMLSSARRLPASTETFCHSSSVMNGISGCASRSAASSTRTSVRRVPRCCASLPRLRAAPWRARGTSRSTRSRRSYKSRWRRCRDGTAEALGDCGLGALQLADDPAVDRGQLHRQRLVQPAVASLGVHQHEAGRVPQLVAEVAIALAALQVEVDVAPERGVGGHREAQRVGAVGRRCPRESACARLRRDLRRILGLAQAGRVLLDQRLEVMPSMMSIGSSVLPSLFDIFLPSASRTMPWM